MLNFKKKSIFTRQTAGKDTTQETEPQNGILAVWGSPGSGKTTVAVKLAKYLSDRKKNVVLLLCDMTAPMLPCHLSAIGAGMRAFAGQRPCSGPCDGTPHQA